MKKIYILFIFVILIIFSSLIYFLIPYKFLPHKITKKIEKKYDRKGEFELVSKENTTYIYRDKRRNLEFTVSLVSYKLGQSALIPWPHTENFDDLNKSIIESKKFEAEELAKTYKLVLKEDKVYINDFDELHTTSEFFFELVKLYDLELKDLIKEKLAFCHGEISDNDINDEFLLDYISYISVIEDGPYLYFKDENGLTSYLERQWMEKLKIEKFNLDK